MIARRLRDSVATKPHVTLHRTADCSGLVEFCRREELSLTAGVVSVVGRVLPEHPELNTWLVDDQLITCGAIDVGIAVDLPGGLIVPVLRAVDRLSPFEVAAQISDLATRARNQTLGPEDVSDATFTVTTLGSLGVQHFTPIISPPQVAILGVGALESRLILDADGAREVPILNLSLSFDHAALDGVPAARFLRDLADAMGQYPRLAPSELHQETR